MKRMHEFLKPNVSEWSEKHTGTGDFTQDGTVISTNDEDLINAKASTVYQFDHFDKKSGKYIYRLVSNQFAFPSASVEDLKTKGVRFDVDDQSLWYTDIAVNYYGAIVETGGLYAVPKYNESTGYSFVLKNEPAHNYVEIGTGGYLDTILWLRGLKDYFVSKGCDITDDGYYAIIPGKYIEIVSNTSGGDTVAKITILPQEIALEPSRMPLFKLLTTQE